MCKCFKLLFSYHKIQNTYRLLKIYLTINVILSLYHIQFDQEKRLCSTKKNNEIIYKIFVHTDSLTYVAR